MKLKNVELIPLLCVKCQAPVPAKVGEVAWVCEQCGQGLLLNSAPAGKNALRAYDFLYSAAIRPGQAGRPFWVSAGKVAITRRETYKGNEIGGAQAFWAAPRLFFIPGWEAALEDVVSNGVELLKNPFTLQKGSPTPFSPVVTLPEDMRALAEFMVMSIEAGRNDALKHVEFDLQLAEAQLWILP